MVRIQLETGYLTVKEGTNFPLNFGVAEIRDLSKRSGTFSKSIMLIGDDNNNTLLNNYYDVNIEAGTFDLNVLTPCAVLQNDIPIVETAYLQLVSVNKTQKSDSYEEEVEYIVLVKDAQADFFTKIDNSELADVDLTDLDHTYNSTNIVASFTNTSGYVYPLTANPINNYPLNSMFPAVYAKEYFDRIHAVNGFSYTWADITTDNFSKAVIPYNGDKPAIDYSDYLLEFNKSSFTPTPLTTITSFTEVTDDEGLFNPTTGVYTPPFYFGTGQTINFEVAIDYDLNLINGTGADAYLVDLNGSSLIVVRRYKARILVKNGAATVGMSDLFNVGGSSATWSENDNPLANGTTTINNVTFTTNLAVTNVLPTDSLTFQFQLLTESINGTSKWKDGASISDADVIITNEIEVNSISITSNLSVNTFGFGQTVELNNFIPKKVKQKDFIKWILFRWNLYVELDADNPNKFIYKTRDKYYDEGAEKDWTYKLSKSRTQELQFLPELASKKIILSDKVDTDEYNKAYLDAFNEVYGQVEYTFDNEYVKGIEKKETIFSPTPMIQTPFNAIVPSFVGSAPKNNIRMLLHNGTTTCDTYHIIDYGTTGITQTTYPIVHHFDDPHNPTFDLNFGVCDYYFYENITLTNNNIYNKFWRRTIAQINSGKMLSAYFDLNEADIQTLELSDKIRIDNSWWNINRIIDYNANDKQLTKVELLSVDTEVTLPPFKTKVIKITTPPIGLDPFPDSADRFYQNANNNYSEGSTIIKGINNTVIAGVKAYVIGDDGFIDSDGYWINGVNTTPPDETFVHQKVLAIGSWDMDATASVTIDIDIDDTKLISVSAVIMTDNLVEALNLETSAQGSWSYTSPRLTLLRRASGTFDSTAYNDTTVNRGTVLIHYTD
jgi:hypothetical protein